MTLMVRDRRGRGEGRGELLTPSSVPASRYIAEDDAGCINTLGGHCNGNRCDSRVCGVVGEEEGAVCASCGVNQSVDQLLVSPSSRLHAHRPHRLLLRTLLLISLITFASCAPDLSGHVDFLRPSRPRRLRRDLPPDAGQLDDQLSGPVPGFSDKDLDVLREYIGYLRGRACRHIPSVSLAVVQRGGTQVSEAVGLADIEKGLKADQYTQYCMASLSKAFTAALLARLLDRKKLTLDIKVKDILKGEFPFMSDYVSNHVTVRDLLLHRTGIPRYDYLWISGVADPKAIFRRLRCMKHRDEFRTRPLYNNILYALAGHVAEVLGGASWETLMKRELLDPLGMTSTTFIRDIGSGPFNTSRARQYMWKNQSNLDIGDPIHRGASDISPALGVYSTAHDMVLWLHFHLSGGKNMENHQIIPKHVMEDMHKGQVSAAAMLRPEVRMGDGSLIIGYNMYGLGWYEGYHRGHRVVMHYGSYPGFYSMITLVPEQNFGIFTSINGGMMDLPYTINSHIHTLAVDLALDIPSKMWFNTSETCQPPQSQPPFDCSTKRHTYSLAPRHLRKYTGTYANPAYGNITLAIADGDVLMVYNTLRFDAFPLSDEDFCIVPVPPEQKNVFAPNNISFGMNATGLIAHITVSFLEFDNIFYKLSPHVVYDDWIEAMCGAHTKPPSCGGMEELPQIRSVAAVMQNIGVCYLLILFIIIV